MFINKYIQLLIILNYFKHYTCVLFFPSNSAFGIIAAIAVPLDLPRRNVFLSYNFEANYNYPTGPGIPPILAERRTKREDNTNATIEQPTPLITRKNFYEALKIKIDRNQTTAENCLLRLICEVNESHIDDYNGVLGSLMHILFSPLSSALEDLSPEYYEAENLGNSGNCRKYESLCQSSLLQLISVSHYDIVQKMLNTNEII